MNEDNNPNDPLLIKLAYVAIIIFTVYAIATVFTS